MAGNNALQETLKAGIEAARRGDRNAARRLLRQVVTVNPDSEVAWMWLASAVESLDERRECLENALRINPNNTRAREALERLGGAAPRAERVRREAAPPPASRPERRRAVPETVITSDRRSILGYGIIALAVIIVLVVIAGLASAVLEQNALSSQATAAAIRQAAVIPTVTATIDPDTYTATPFIGLLVPAPSFVPTLPPTFTPTFTPTATVTPPPTETPFPMSAFSLVYAAYNPGDSQPALYRSDGEGLGEVMLGASADGFNDVAFNPDGVRIAFVRTVTYTSDAGAEVTAPELFVADLNDLAGARQITRLGGNILAHPTWSPDGIQLVFVSDYDGDAELWYITEDGNNLRQITMNDWRDTDPAWSPLGDRIFFASEQGTRPGSGLLEIFSMTPEGDSITQLTDAEGSSYQPAWSPDGARVTFVSDRNGDGDIYIMDRDGQQPFLLTPDDKDAEDHSPVFTPDATGIVFASNRDGDTFHLFMIDLSGHLRLSLANTGHDDFQSLAFQPAVLRLRQ